MYIANVVGNVVATRKVEKLVGQKFLIVCPYPLEKHKDQFRVVADAVGAGIGETVLVASGSAARISLEDCDLPVDETVVGIVSSMELSENEL